MDLNINNSVWKVLLTIVGIMLIFLSPLLGILLLLWILVTMLKLSFSLLKYVVYIAVAFFILCLIIGIFVA